MIGKILRMPQRAVAGFRAVWDGAVPLSRAPHSLSLYDALLGNLRKTYSNVRFLPLEEHVRSRPGANELRVVLRHDLDTAACVERALLLAGVEAQHGVLSSWFVRVDAFHYRPSQCGDLVASLVEKGHRVGLHTAAYLSRDALGELRDAAAEFETSFGFPPSSFTVHGFLQPPLLRERRLAFEQAAATGAAGVPISAMIWSPSTV